LTPRAEGRPVPPLSRWLLGLGIAATLAANVAHGLGHGLTGAAMAAWPGVALVGSYELLMMVIRRSQVSAEGMPETRHDADPLREQVAKSFAEQLAGGPGSVGARYPSSASRRPTPGAAVPDYLARGVARQGENSVA